MEKLSGLPFSFLWMRDIETFQDLKKLIYTATQNEKSLQIEMTGTGSDGATLSSPRIILTEGQSSAPLVINVGMEK